MHHRILDIPQDAAGLVQPALSPGGEVGVGGGDGEVGQEWGGVQQDVEQVCDGQVPDEGYCTAVYFEDLRVECSVDHKRVPTYTW